MPDRRWTQPNAYKEQQYPALDVMRQLYGEHKLTPEQARFMGPFRPEEELYDIQDDPHELRDLAESPEHDEILARVPRGPGSMDQGDRRQGGRPRAAIGDPDVLNRRAAITRR